jgi:cellulose synthase (UDP-forming)
MQYFGTATFYMVGIAPGLLLLVPPLQIYFGLAPINSGVSFGTWLLYYLGFYFMQVVVALYTIGSFRWETLMLATASFPIYGKAMVNAIFKKDTKWHVTGAQRRKASPFNFITQQLMAFVFLAITSVVGIWQAVTVSAFTLALFWNLLNTFILGAFVVTAFRESRHNRREEKGLPPKGSAKVAAEAAARIAAQPQIGSGLSERTYEGLPPVRVEATPVR